MRDDVIREAEAYLDGMVVLDRQGVAFRETSSSVEIGYKGCSIELPLTQSATEDAARYLIGAAVFEDARQTGRYLYSGSKIE